MKALLASLALLAILASIPPPATADVTGMVIIGPDDRDCPSETVRTGVKAPPSLSAKGKIAPDRYQAQIATALISRGVPLWAVPGVKLLPGGAWAWIRNYQTSLLLIVPDGGG